MCDVAIFDWIRGNNNCPYIKHVARYTGTSPLDVISSVPINLDTFNPVLDISASVINESQISIKFMVFTRLQINR